MSTPIIAVELAYGDAFELTADDADILIQLRSDTMLWQKERLLNIALRQIPKTVRYVAWIDCDVILGREDWPRATTDLLRRHPLVELYSEWYDLDRDVLPSGFHLHSKSPDGFSIAYKRATTAGSPGDFRPPTGTRAGWGYGWAARRDLLERHGFYDAFILGGGDCAMACAAYGKFEDAIQLTKLTSAQITHYLGWARPFYADVNGDVGFVNGRLFHLWHGDLANRRYRERHLELARFEFDPSTDIALDSQGLWAWASDKQQLHEYARSYFAMRNEDGE